MSLLTVTSAVTLKFRITKSFFYSVFSFDNTFRYILWQMSVFEISSFLDSNLTLRLRLVGALEFLECIVETRRQKGGYVLSIISWIVFFYRTCVFYYIRLFVTEHVIFMLSDNNHYNMIKFVMSNWNIKNYNPFVIIIYPLILTP